MVSGSAWVDRASKWIDAWPVGPVAASMLGAATGFFCWAMPYSPVIGRIAVIIAPALLAFVATLLAFRWIDARGARPIADEGDGYEDWLTRSGRIHAAPVGPSMPRRERQAARPFIIDANDPAANGGVRDDGWPVPPVDRPAASFHDAPDEASAIDPVVVGEWRMLGEDDSAGTELLLDAPLPSDDEDAADAGDDFPSAPEISPEIAMEAVMERLAMRIDSPASPGPASRRRPLSDEEALRAALADLQRMAARRP